MLISVEAYLRPSEAISLTSASLLPPTRQGVLSWVVWLFPSEQRARSKTGESDDTVTLDSGRLGWLTEVMSILSEKKKGEPLFETSYSELFAAMARVTHRLDLALVPYQMRHSGASIDRATLRRSIESIQKRGRWASARSVRRYEKMGRLNESWRTLSATQQAYFLACEARIKRTILRGDYLPELPGRW